MSRHPEHPLRRVTALVAALCVFALMVFAASPSLHASLHGHDHVAGALEHDAPAGGAEHTCAVTLVAQGAMTLLIFCLLLPVRFTVTGLKWRATHEAAAAHPRYWLVPAHAPPAA
jgi:hypothetical protein